MKDALGNNLRVGQKLWWASKGILCTLAEISDGGIVNVATRSVTPPKIKLEMDVTVANNVTSPVAILGDFLVLQDPNEAQHADKIVERASAKPS